MGKQKDKIDVSRRNFLMGFRKLREKDPEQASAPVAKTDETFDILKEANLAYKDRNWEDASAKYKEFLKQESKNPDARFRLGRCLYQMEKYMQAKIEFEQAMRLRREDQDTILYLGLTLMRLKRPEKAMVMWRMYMNPEAMVIQREVNIQVAYLEDAGIDSPPPEQMADVVEAAIEQYRQSKLEA